jgi:hypothetical protein
MIILVILPLLTWHVDTITFRELAGVSMTTFYYYKDDTLIDIIEASTLTAADVMFEVIHGVVVTLEEKKK